MADPAPDIPQTPAIDFDVAADAMRRTEMLDAIHEQASEHFYLCLAAIGRRDWHEAEAQQAKHTACCEAWRQVETAPVVGQA